MLALHARERMNERNTERERERGILSRATRNGLSIPHCAKKLDNLPDNPTRVNRSSREDRTGGELRPEVNFAINFAVDQLQILYIHDCEKLLHCSQRKLRLRSTLRCKRFEASLFSFPLIKKEGEGKNAPQYL